MTREEVAQDALALLAHRARPRAGRVGGLSLVRDVGGRDHRAGRGSRRAEHHERHAREHDRTGAHDARLERHVHRAVDQAPGADALPCLAQREDLGVARGVAGLLATVTRASDDLAAAHDDRADRHVLVLDGGPRFVERGSHEGDVLGGARQLHAAMVSGQTLGLRLHPFLVNISFCNINASTRMGEQMIREQRATTLPGVLMLVVFLALEIFSIWWFVDRILAKEWWMAGTAVLVFVVAFVGLFGLTPVSPNESRVLQVLGSYAGTIHQAGFWWVNPFAFPRRRVSLRIRNFESSKLKVNDHDGNPVEIAAIVVWRVVETAEEAVVVLDLDEILRLQTEAAVRNLATTYPYDAHSEGQVSLRTSSQEITDRLRTEIQERLAKAGIEVIEARLSHLAYAPEIAQAMLRRQQASAVVAARMETLGAARRRDNAPRSRASPRDPRRCQ